MLQTVSRAGSGQADRHNERVLMQHSHPLAVSIYVLARILCNTKNTVLTCILSPSASLIRSLAYQRLGYTFDLCEVFCIDKFAISRFLECQLLT